jgi:hypothetical protein
MAQKKRRKFHRYVPPTNMPCFVFNHFSTHVGWIKDINTKGLAFEYLHKPGSSCSPEVVDIFSNVDGPEKFYIKALPCQRIYDIAVPAEAPSDKGLQKRRCGIAYIAPPEAMVNEIAAFIVSHMKETPLDNESS